MIPGLVMLGLGVIMVVLAVFTAGGDAKMLGFNMPGLGLYLLGVASGLAILWGGGLTKWGAKRNLKQRREARQLGRLSAKLDKREAERRTGDED
jgi:hypothetical protein